MSFELRKIAEGIEYLHSTHLVHGDIKSAIDFSCEAGAEEVLVLIGSRTFS